jgi:hypothetical protein
MKYITTTILLGMIIMIGCEVPQDLNRPGDRLSGNVWHTDSNIFLIGGFYSVSLYDADKPNPFYQIPVRTDSLALVKRDYVYDTPFLMEGIPSGRYYLAATWSSYPRIPDEIPIVLGTYGCDTTRNCNDHRMIVFPNYEGAGRFFISWTDLNKRLY